MSKSTIKRRGTTKRESAPGDKGPARAVATRRPRKRSVAAKASPASPEPPSPGEEAAYIEALIASGQAARLERDGKLPAGATHKIVEEPDGKITVVRRRFSIT